VTALRDTARTEVRWSTSSPSWVVERTCGNVKFWACMLTIYNISPCWCASSWSDAVVNGDGAGGRRLTRRRRKRTPHADKDIDRIARRVVSLVPRLQLRRVCDSTELRCDSRACSCHIAKFTLKSLSVRSIPTERSASTISSAGRRVKINVFNLTRSKTLRPRPLHTSYLLDLSYWFLPTSHHDSFVNYAMGQLTAELLPQR